MSFMRLKNTASRTIVSDRMQDTQNTNQSWVKGNTVLTDGEITVTKKNQRSRYHMGTRKPGISIQNNGKRSVGSNACL